MTTMELIREMWFWFGAVGLPAITVLAFGIACLTTPLPERRKGKA